MLPQTINQNKAVQPYQELGLGKVQRYDLQNTTDCDINFAETRKFEKYDLNILSKKHETDALLSLPLGKSVEEFLLLKNTYQYFGLGEKMDIPKFVDVFRDKKRWEDSLPQKKSLETNLYINFKDIKIKESDANKSSIISGIGYCSLFSSLASLPFIISGNAVDLRVPLLFGLFGALPPFFEWMGDKLGENEELYGLSNLIYRTGIFKESFKNPIKKLNRLEGELIKNNAGYSEYQEKERRINKLLTKDVEVNETDFNYLSCNINELVDEKESYKSEIPFLRNEKNKVQSKLNNLLSNLSNYKGIHIIANAEGEDSYEQVMDFYKNILSFKLKEFDLKKSVDKIVTAWDGNYPVPVKA